MVSKQEILDLLWDEPIVVAHAVGFKDMNSLHNEWLKSFLYAVDDQTLLAHRGSYKTTCISVFLAIHAVLRPNENVLFFRKTEGDTHEVIRQTVKILESGVMQYIVSVLYGKPLVLLERSGGKITTNLMTSAKGTSQILGLGIGTSITGKHADIVCTDDIVNKDDRVSRAEREKTKLAYQELENIKNRNGRFINTGTPWHKEDAISTLMPNVTKYTVYDTGLVSEEKQRKLRQSMTPSLYAANYELKHIADVDSLFSEPLFYDGNEEAIFNGKAHVDAAYGGSDFTAYTVLKKAPNGNIIGFGKVWHGHVSQHINEMQAFHKRFRAGTISCEKNADKGFLARDLRSAGFAVIEYSEKENKYLKIATYLKKEWCNIRWLPCTDPEYLAQILDYTENAEHDDAPDSAASLIRQMSQVGHIGSKAEILYGR